MSRNVYVDNVLRERWDDAAHTMTAWTPEGVLSYTRPYTAIVGVGVTVGVN